MSLNISGFEMSIDEDARKKQVVFNQRMVEQSNGLLAPINSQERYLSVSSGHVSQFVKPFWLSASRTSPTWQMQGVDLTGSFCRETPSSKRR